MKLQKFLLRLFYNPKKEWEKNRKYSFQLLEKVLRENNISYKQIKSIHSITVSDFLAEDFELLKRRIENGSYIENDPLQMGWNKDHLHFYIASVDEGIYVYAILHPYEFSVLPQTLWFHKLENASQEYLDKLQRVNLYR